MPWPSERSLDGGLDPVPVRGVPGLLWLCGKHVVGADPEAALGRVGEPGVIVCLNEHHELDGRYPGYVEWLRREEGRRARWFPIHDLHAPGLAVLRPLLDELVDRLRASEHVIVQCGAGFGRAGTVAVCALMLLGASRDQALAAVAGARPMAGPEAGPQHDLVAALAHDLAPSPPDDG